MKHKKKTLGSLIAVLMAAVLGFLFAESEELDFAPMAFFDSSSTHGTPPAFASQPAEVESTFNLDDYFVKVGGVVRTDAIPSGTSSETAFRTFCEFSHLSYDDPVLYPGEPGVSHLHMFYGNPTTDANSTYASLRAATNNTALHDDFTCAGGPINGSGYWHPAVILDADGDPNTTTGDKVVKPAYAIVYYKSAISAVPTTVRIPRGFSYIFGFNPTTGSDPLHSFKGWSCGGGTLYSSLADANGNARFTCPAGTMLRLYFAAPRCWNGTDLTSPNGRDHVADLVGSSCPSTHPYRLPKFELIVWFQHDGTDDFKDWYFSSDRMPGYPRYNNGATGHTDWMGGWDDDIFSISLNRCLGLSGNSNDYRSCTDSLIGDGRKMIQFAQDGGPISFTSEPQAARLLDLPEDPAPAEVDPVIGKKSGSRVRRMHRH